MSLVTNPTVSASTFTSTMNQQSSQGEESTELKITKVLLILLLIAIVVGNTLVLVTTWLEKQLHQPTKYFIACLAVADLLVGVVSIPIRLYTYFHRNELIELTLCRFWVWIDQFCEAASIVTLVVISVDRYFKISKPFKYKTHMTTSRSFIVIFFIWMISVASATVGQFSYGDSKGVTSAAGSGCYYDNQVYFTVLSGAFFYFPTLIIFLMYVLIFFIAYKRQKLARMGALGQSFAAGTKKKEIQSFLQQMKTIRILALVVFTFVLCWGPFFTFTLLILYENEYISTSLDAKEQNILVTVFLTLLPHFNSLCNPIIYACFDRVYSNAFKNLFQRTFHSKRFHRRRETFNKSLSTHTQSFRLKDSRSRSRNFQGNIDNHAETRLYGD